MICSAGPACQHDEQVPELCVHVLVQRFTRYPSACVCCQLIRPSWKSTTDTQERNLKLRSLHVLSSHKRLPNSRFDDSASCKSCRWWYIASLRWFHSRYGQELFCSHPLYLLQIVALHRSQSSDFVEECLHHPCLSLPIGLSLSPLLSCHVHDSRCITQRQIPLIKQRQLRYHVK